MTKEEDLDINEQKLRSSMARQHQFQQEDLYNGGKNNWGGIQQQQHIHSMANAIQHSSRSSNMNMNPNINPNQHRRGISLDETRVQSGLIGVGLGRNNNSVADQQLYPPQLPVPFISLHRRHHSHNSPPNHFGHRFSSGNRLPSSSSSTPSSHSSSHSSHSQSQAKALHPEVKFVNSTVEILEDQIRKEEAPKKKRTRTTPEQLRILQKAFHSDPMPNSSTRVALAKKLGMNSRAVQVWFQNRRAKAKLDAKRTDGGSGRSSGTDSPRLGQYDEYDDMIDDTGDEVILDENDPYMGSYVNGTIYHPHSISRSQSLPFLAINQHDYSLNMNHNRLIDTNDLVLNGQILPYAPEDMMLMDEGAGMALGRSDSIPFAPYEFSTGSSFYSQPTVPPVPVHPYNQPLNMAMNVSMNYQSNPMGNNAHPRPDTNVLLPQMDDPVWPVDLTNEQDLFSQQYNMRRSFSLPNVVYQPPLPSSPPDYYPSYDLTEESVLLEEDLQLGHRRSRSHSISHHPDYPENVNDYLTATTTSNEFDDL